MDRKPEKLEVSENLLNKNLLITSSKSKGTSVIAAMGPSKLLDRVKNFLPEIAAAQETLSRRIDAGENVDIENCPDDQNYVEMNVGIFQKDRSKNEISVKDDADWSEDSEPDSPLSAPDLNNEYTSDSDPDSSSASTSSNSSPSGSPLSRGRLKMPAQVDSKSKRPLIEEISSTDVSAHKKEKL